MSSRKSSVKKQCFFKFLNNFYNPKSDIPKNEGKTVISQNSIIILE